MSWYQTGICIIQGPGDIELQFEFEYCEGSVYAVIGTPYNKEAHGNHGYLLF